jgi:hypothetical protein
MKKIPLIVTLSLVFLAVPHLQASIVYDAAADFSPTNNPNGVWSYGWSSSLGSAFNIDVSSTTLNGLDLWEGAAPGVGGLFYPVVAHNGTTNPITSGTVSYLAGQLGFHPGPGDQYGVIRFTAPIAETLVLSSSFTGLDFVGPTTTDVHVLLDGSPIFNGAVDGFGAGSGPSFATTLTLAMGETVDFAVGYGSNGNYLFDSTGITATLGSVAVPEPSTMGLAVLSGLMLAGHAWRRRRTVSA